MSPSITDVLGRAALFQGLEPEQLAQLTAAGESLRFDAGQRVFAEGDSSDGLYVVVQGEVRITCRDDDGEDLELTRIQGGGFFGEMALLDEHPRSATVSATVPTELFRLSQPVFLDFLLRSRGVLSELLAGLAQRVRETNSQALEATLRKRRLHDQMEIDRLRALSELVAGIAHEVNTPLGIASTAVTIMDRSLKDEAWAQVSDPDLKLCAEELDEAGALIRTNIKRAHDLIKSFKNLSVRQLTDELETVRIAGIVQETLNLFAPRSRQAKLQIEVDCSIPPEATEWTGYPGHLSRILLNLLQNIERYAYPDGDGGRVVISIAAEDDAAPFQLEVRDFGQGIEAKNLERLFDPFYTTGRMQGGSGLGLAIVQNLVRDALQGTITASSEPGQGASFRLSLPRVIAASSGARS